MTFEEILKRFEADCRLRRMTPKVVKTYSNTLKLLESECSSLGIDILDLDRDRLKLLLIPLRERNLSFATESSYFSKLSTFYEYMVEEGMKPGNPVPSFRKRYLRQYKKDDEDSRGRTAVSVDEMRMLVVAALKPRDRAMILLMAKTGVRESELLAMDLGDIDWDLNSITLKPHPKRSNRVVFFDNECKRILERWLQVREGHDLPEDLEALFLTVNNGDVARISPQSIIRIVNKAAVSVGLRDKGKVRNKPEAKQFSPHYCRHWFTTHLRRNGMRREFIMKLRGDVRKDAIDIYDHIELDELREAYLAAIPQLGL